jgi:hypothetical protein
LKKFQNEIFNDALLSMYLSLYVLIDFIALN